MSLISSLDSPILNPGNEAKNMAQHINSAVHANSSGNLINQAPEPRLFQLSKNADNDVYRAPDMDPTELSAISDDQKMRLLSFRLGAKNFSAPSVPYACVVKKKVKVRKRRIVRRRRVPETAAPRPKMLNSRSF